MTDDGIDDTDDVMVDVVKMMGKVLLIFGGFILLGRAFLHFSDGGSGIDDMYFILIPVSFGLLYYIVFRVILDT